MEAFVHADTVLLSTEVPTLTWLWSTAQHSTAQHSTAQHSTAQHSTWTRHYSQETQQLMSISCDGNTMSVRVCAYVYKLNHWLSSIPNSTQAQPKEEGEGDNTQDIHVHSCSSHVVRKHVASNIQKRLQRCALNCSWDVSS